MVASSDAPVLVPDVFVEEGQVGLLGGNAVLAALEAVPEPFTAEAADAALHALGERTGRQMGDLVHPVRVAVSGPLSGPGVEVPLLSAGTTPAPEAGGSVARPDLPLPCPLAA